MKIKTKWDYSLETEALRLVHTAHQIAVGFYKVNNFIVLPYGPDYKDPSIVTFPDLPYFKIPRFWEKAKRVEVKDVPIKAPRALVEQVKNLLNEANLPEPNYTNCQKTWDNAQNAILAETEKIMPAKRGAVKTITIYPTLFGTNTSFNRPSTFPVDLYLYLREDQGIHAITEAILTSLTRSDVYDKLDGTWQESEILVDWLTIFSPLSQVLQKYEPKPNFLPTMKQVRFKQRGELLQKSKEFYQKLGLDPTANVFSLKRETPTIFGKQVEDFTIREKEIFVLMINKRNQLITVDEVANILFKDDENAFSLQAIAKAIQRLRDKLEENGVSGSFIQTRRGQGYILVN